MESHLLLPLPEGMQIDQIQASENEVSTTVIATHSVIREFCSNLLQKWFLHFVDVLPLNTSIMQQVARTGYPYCCNRYPAQSYPCDP